MRGVYRRKLPLHLLSGLVEAAFDCSHRSAQLDSNFLYTQLFVVEEKQGYPIFWRKRINCTLQQTM